MSLLITMFTGNLVIFGIKSLDFIVASLWGTKTSPHYLVMKNHLDLKDGGLEWRYVSFVYQGGVKKKEFPERWG